MPGNKVTHSPWPGRPGEPPQYQLWPDEGSPSPPADYDPGDVKKKKKFKTEKNIK